MTSSAASIWMRERKTNGSTAVNRIVLNAQSHFHQAAAGNCAQLVVNVIHAAQTTSSAVSRPSRGGIPPVQDHIDPNGQHRRCQGERKELTKHGRDVMRAKQVHPYVCKRHDEGRPEAQ